MDVPSEPCSILGLDFGSRSSRKSCSSQTYTAATVCSPSLLHVAQSLYSAKSAETPSWRTTRAPSRRDNSRVSNSEPQSLSLRNSLWSDQDFVPRRVKPRSVCSSYPTMSPPPNFTIRLLPEGSPNHTKKTHQSEAFPYPRKYFVQLQTFHLTLPMLIINIRETFTFRHCCNQIVGRRPERLPSE